MGPIGRDEEVTRMVQLLRHQRFMMVIGPSGSGKSSLVYAGLLPELQRSRYFAPGFWLIRQMRPGPRPTETLAGLVEATGAQFEYETVQTLLDAHSPTDGHRPPQRRAGGRSAAGGSAACYRPIKPFKPRPIVSTGEPIGLVAPAARLARLS